MSPPTTRDPATAGLGSSARLISRTPVMFRCCCAPTSCGRSWLPTPDVTFIDSPAGRIVPGSLRASRQWNLPHELLDAAEITARFPNFTPHPEDIALYDPIAGFARPELTVRAHLEIAEKAGATLQFGEPVLDWNQSAAGVQVVTGRWSYTAGQFVICPGAWAPQVL